MISYYEDLMQWLSDYCKRHHIHVFYKSELDPNQKSYSYRYPRVIFLNDHWQIANEKPFILAHEIGHAMCTKEDLVTSKDTYSNISKMNVRQIFLQLNFYENIVRNLILNLILFMILQMLLVYLENTNIY